MGWCHTALYSDSPSPLVWGFGDWGLGGKACQFNTAGLRVTFKCLNVPLPWLGWRHLNV